MRKIGLKLIVIILFFNSFVIAQTFSYYDFKSGTIKYFDGLTGKKNKIKNGIKQGRIEQVVLKKDIIFLDEYNYVPNIEKSFIDTNISVKNLIKNEVFDFFVFVGNYIDGKKQGEFKLLEVDKGRIRELASINYLNDTLEGNFKFIDCYFDKQSFGYGIDYLTVLMSRNRISNQTIKISDKLDYIVFKNNKLDSGCIHFDYQLYYFKKLESPGEFNLTFFHSRDNFKIGKTVLRVSNGNKFAKRLKHNERLFEDLKNLKCEGVCLTKDRYTTFSINNSKFQGFINCYYFNDSLNYSINTTTGQIDIWVDFAIDKKIKTLSLNEFGDIRFELVNDLLFPYESREFLSDKAGLNLDQYKTGYFKIAEIRNMLYSNGSVFGTKFILDWKNNNPFSIDYKIGSYVFRNETWQKNSYGNSEKQFTNFDSNGNVLSSSVIEKKQKEIERKENEQNLLRVFGVKDDNEVVSCAYCKQKLVKKNGETIRSVQCSSSSIPCMNAKGLPCEWTFCNMKCSNDFQCAQCAQYKSYRANCR